MLVMSDNNIKTAEEQFNLSTSDLFQIVIENFLVMFFIASGVGFTLGSLGVLSPNPDIYTFTGAFSLVWGCVGAAYSWIRNRDEVRLPKLFNDMLGTMGIDQKENRLYRKFKDILMARSRYIVIIGVKPAGAVKPKPPTP